VSLELDDELSELEATALRRHLEVCSSCAAARAEQAGFTALLRAAPLVASARPVAVEFRPQLGARALFRPAVALTLAVLAVALAFVLLPSPPVTSSAALAFSSQTERLRYDAAEHIRIDPRPDLAPIWLPRLSPYAARALL
jgi:anti-sigma factor RsiW